MKKFIPFIILLLSSLFLFPILANAVLPTTSVTIQVTDTPDNQAWNNGSWTVQLQPLTGDITNTNFIIVGTTTPVPNLTQSGVLNGTGGASGIVLTPSSSINPIGSLWNFTVCPQASTTCFNKTFFIFGTTQTITITPPSVRINATKMVLAYADSEVNTAVGQLYYNLTTGTLRLCTSLTCNGSGFSAIAGGGGGGGCAVNPDDGGCALLGNPSIDQFIGASIGPGTGWLIQLIAAGFNSTVPINVLGTNGGQIVWGFGPDPGIGSGVAFAAPTSGTPYTLYFPGLACSGYWVFANVANKVGITCEPNIDLANDVGLSVLNVVNGGTSASTPGGALANLFPTPIRSGDMIYWTGTVWNNFGGNTGGGSSTGFWTENGTGNPGWVQVPIPVVDGGYGLSTQAVNIIYKGNGTAAPQQSHLSDDGSNVIMTEVMSNQTMGYLTTNMAAQSTATPTNITGMTWAIAANKRYKLKCEVGLTLSTSATIQFDLNGPGSPTSYSIDALGNLGLSGGVVDKVSVGVVAWGTATPVSSAAGNTSIVHISAQIQNGATSSGTNLTLRTIADGTHNITVLADSVCELTQQN